jgi:hypothetical protein
MSDRAHVVVIVAAVVTLGVIFRLVRLQQLRSKYALLWLSIALLLLPIAAWPGMLEWISDRIGVGYPPTTLLLFACGFLFAVVVHFSWELSRLEMRSRTLAEEVALLRARIEDLHGPTRLGRPDEREAGPDAE